MAARAEAEGSPLDTAKLILALVLLVAGIFGYYYFSDYALLYRVFGVVGFSLASLFAIFSTAIGKDFLIFLKESRIEVRKVVWPTRQETVQATLVVVALVFLVGTILWLLDMSLFWGVSHLTGQGK